jgi:HK97 family phage prohead protease
MGGVMRDGIQRRFSRPGESIRLQQRDGGGLPKIVGYAAVFYRAGDPGTEYELWPGCVERIMPGAFDKAVAGDDVRGLVNHDAALVLGRNGPAGTLRLFVDSRGLGYEIDPPDTTYARDLIQSLQRGDINGSSFAFLPRETTYRDIRGENGAPDLFIMERTDVKLFDVGPVTYPAYDGTEAGTRAAGDLDAIRAEIERHRGGGRRDADRLAVELALMDADAAD